MSRKIIAAIFLFMLFGFQDESLSASATSEIELKSQIEKLKIENKKLNNQISDMVKVQEEEIEALRETLNLSFDIFTAMSKKDFKSLSTLSTTNIQTNKKESKILFTKQKDIYKISDVNYVLENLEYRYYHLKDGKMTIVFAKYLDDGHMTIHLEFVEKDGQWLFDYLATDG